MDATPEIRARIEGRARAFDVASLLRVLAELGYGPADLRYQSHRSDAFRPALVEAVTFEQTAGRRERVLITLNVGLVAAQSPLPSSILRHLGGLEPVSEPLARLLRFLDHFLIEDLLIALHPECFDHPGWMEAARNLPRLLTMTSPCALHWLFRQVFPEADVRVRRAILTRRDGAPETVTGQGALGLSTLGGHAETAAPGLVVELHVPPSWDRGALDQSTGNWELEVRRRMAEQVIPLLGRLALRLDVYFSAQGGAGVRFDEQSLVGLDVLGTERRTQVRWLIHAQPRRATSGGRGPASRALGDFHPLA